MCTATKSIYIGEFKNGAKEGKGNGNKDKTDPESNQYEGDYKNDKKKEKEYSSGNQAIYTKEGIMMMNDMAMERCTGLMDQVIKACGIKGFNMEKAKWSFLMGLLKRGNSKIIFFSEMIT